MCATSALPARNQIGQPTTASGWNPRGVSVKFRASLEDDLYAMDTFKPDIAIGTTPVVQHAKELSIPSLYFTNLISARPLMGVAGAGSLAEVINTAIAGKERFQNHGVLLRRCR